MVSIGKKYNNYLCSYFLGLCYLHGWGVEENHNEAFNLFKEAEKHYITLAKNALGYMHYCGLVAENNPLKAFEYFNDSLHNDTSLDSYYNQVELLLENNNI